MDESRMKTGQNCNAVDKSQMNIFHLCIFNCGGLEQIPLNAFQFSCFAHSELVVSLQIVQIQHFINSVLPCCTCRRGPCKHSSQKQWLLTISMTQMSVRVFYRHPRFRQLELRNLDKWSSLAPDNLPAWQPGARPPQQAGNRTPSRNGMKFGQAECTRDPLVNNSKRHKKIYKRRVKIERHRHWCTTHQRVQ